MYTSTCVLFFYRGGSFRHDDPVYRDDPFYRDNPFYRDGSFYRDWSFCCDKSFYRCGLKSSAFNFQFAKNADSVPQTFARVGTYT